jgi:hypothetical protein
MGWGRTLLLGDIGNRLDIADTERNLEDLRRELAGSYEKDLSQDETIQKLVRENAELKLYLAALMRLLIRKGAISKEELAAVVTAVDAEDGTVDGGFNGKVS